MIISRPPKKKYDFFKKNNNNNNINNNNQPLTPLVPSPSQLRCGCFRSIAIITDNTPSPLKNGCERGLLVSYGFLWFHLASIFSRHCILLNPIKSYVFIVSPWLSHSNTWLTTPHLLKKNHWGQLPSKRRPNPGEGNWGANLSPRFFCPTAEGPCLGIFLGLG